MMMLPDAGAALDCFPEPILIVQNEGTVAFGNRSARSLLGEVAGASLSDLSSDGPERLRAYLRRCSGSKEALIGKLVVLDRSGQQLPFRCHGSLLRLRTEGEPTLILIRFLGPPEERFSAFTQQLKDLHAEIRKRRRVQSILEEALRERELLLRELHHRVRNHLQMLLSMLSSARVSAQHSETQAVLGRACSRVAAIGAAQQVLYGAGLESVSTTEFLDEVCQTIMRTLGGAHEIVLDVDSAELSNDLAAPVALMLNELLTNAVKHAFAGDHVGRIEISLRALGGEFELTVTDNGIGFDASSIREGSSGLGLVRGLVRKLGGTLAVLREGGTRCIVRFRDPERGRTLDAEGSSNAAESDQQQQTGSDIDSGAVHAGRRAGVRGWRRGQQY